ncbi:MAG: pentapeptide repeat-containing protein [Alphaproteobacteria bacterium]|nr:pentapeptide repeat-containing protein [Alphaproteobacteria bacterium]MCZ6837923.1 pentapeptide repeat-containing protein [Alphaproteobacteria bacterium]
MAHKEQVELLKQGAERWNAWRAKKPETIIDLSGGALRGFDMTGADLSGANLSGADLRGASLSGANLVDARLEGANLFKVMLDGADLNRANLSGAQFLHCGQLEVAHNWQSAYRDEELACGAAIPAMSGK